jgi:hypothetical protein
MHLTYSRHSLFKFAAYSFRSITFRSYLKLRRSYLKLRGSYLKLRGSYLKLRKWDLPNIIFIYYSSVFPYVKEVK